MALKCGTEGWLFKGALEGWYSIRLDYILTKYTFMAKPKFFEQSTANYSKVSNNILNT